MKHFLLITVLLALFSGCAASVDIPGATQSVNLTAGTVFEQLVLGEDMPMIDWMLVPLGADEMDILPGLGISAGDIIDTSAGGTTVSYGFWSETDTTSDLWGKMNVSLTGISMDHANVVCRDGIVSCVGYEFHLADFSDETTFWSAMQELRLELITALEGRAVFLGERGDITDNGCGSIYRAYWSDGAVQLEMEIINDSTCELRLNILSS